MSRSREILVVLCLFPLAAMVVFFISTRPKIVAGPPLPPGKIEPYFNNLLLAPDGTLWHIGYAPSGGAGTLTFTTFIPGNDWVALCGSHFAGMAIKEDGSLWSWSTQFTGNTSRLTFIPPAQLGSDRDWAQVRYGFNGAVLLKKNGSLWFLGGKFIDSTRTRSSPEPGQLPVQIGSDSDWAAVETIGRIHYALKRDGTLWYWGELNWDSYEELPLLLSPEPVWSKMTAGSGFIAAQRHDGSLWLHGPGAHDVAADFAPGSGSLPFRVGADSDWVNAAGGQSLIAQKADGSWWASGKNDYAQLGVLHGFGAPKYLARPKRIPIDFDVWAWNVSWGTTMILTRDGSFYFMGKRPGSGRSSGAVASVQHTLNKTTKWIPGMPPLFDWPGDDWSHTPVKIGELPPSVISALRSGR